MATRARRDDQAEPMRLSMAHLDEALPAPVLARISAYVDAIERLASPRFAPMIEVIDRMDSRDASIPWSDVGGRKVVTVEHLSKMIERRVGALDSALVQGFLRDVVCVWEERGAELEEGAIVWPSRLPAMTLGQSVAYWRALNAADAGRKRGAALASMLRETTGPDRERPRI